MHKYVYKLTVHNDLSNLSYLWHYYWGRHCNLLLTFQKTDSNSVIPSNHLIPVVPSFSCLQPFQASGFFPMSQFFTSGGQVSEPQLQHPINAQEWFPLGLTGLISLLSKGLSSIFLQYHSSKASLFWHSSFFMVQHSNPYCEYSLWFWIISISLKQWSLCGNNNWDKVEWDKRVMDELSE